MKYVSESPNNINNQNQEPDIGHSNTQNSSACPKGSGRSLFQTGLPAAGFPEHIKRRSTLAEKIRRWLILLELPLIILMLLFLYNLWRLNTHYESLIESVSQASGFSLDFKKEFDYETYLLIAGSSAADESALQALLDDAGEVVSRLETLNESGSNSGRSSTGSSGNTSAGSSGTSSGSNSAGSADTGSGTGSTRSSGTSQDRLEIIKRYLGNLATYKQRIVENLAAGDRYAENISIWENDVQIVTELLQESVYEYIYYDVKDMQESHENLRSFYVRVLKYSLAAFVFIVVLTAILSYTIPRSITRPVRQLYEVTQQVAKGDLTARSHVDAGVEITSLSDSMNAMLDRIGDLMGQVRTEQENLSRAQLELLQAQINPHFLYNTLDAIVWLAETGEQQKVVSMVGSLSDFFRISLSQGRDIIPLREELRHVRSYLEIQQVRYEDILQFRIDVPERFGDCAIPKISIQPLAENALYHGIKNKRGGGTITITAGEEENGGLAICVADDGIGMDEAMLTQVRRNIRRASSLRGNGLSRNGRNGTTGTTAAAADTAKTSDTAAANAADSTSTTAAADTAAAAAANAAGPDHADKGFALYNVHARLQLYCGPAYGLTIDSTPGEGTRATLHLPLPADTAQPAVSLPEEEKKHNTAQRAGMKKL